MNKIWVILFLLLFFQESHGQIINIDKFDTTEYSRVPKWDGDISSGLEIDKQKSTLYDATTLLDISLQKYHELFIFSASNRFTYDGEQDHLNTGYLHFRWRHMYKDPPHIESYIQYNWDEVIGLKHRMVSGTNVRYSLWHKSMSDITFATGIMYETELWGYNAVDSLRIPSNPIDARTINIKNNNYVKWEGRVSEGSNVTVAVFYQSKFNHFLKPRISGNINFDTKISNHFSLGIKFTGTYDSKPVVPIFNFYYSISNNLIYNF